LAEDEEVDDESLISFISRLEGASGTHRIKVPKRFLDKHGNMFLPPQAVYLVDTEGEVHESADTSGQVPVNTLGIGAGNIRMVSGTFTKDAVGTTGTLTITPAAGDVLYFMYGYVLIGATHAGAASELRAGIAGSPGTSDMLQLHLYDATADAGDNYLIPGIGEVPAAGAVTTAGVYHRMQTMILGADLLNEDGDATALAGAPRYVVQYETMANTEDWFATLYFLSSAGLAVTVTPAAGAWA